MTTKTNVPEALLAKIRGGNRFLLTSHVSPDGDAVGSALGLARVLRTLGKGATVWLRDPVPGVYRDLPGAGRIHAGEEPPAGFPDLYSSVVVLECPSLERTGLGEHFGSKPIFNIDHHLGNEHYGAVNWVDPSAPAVGEMIFHLAKEMKIDLDEDAADLFYLAMVTDTGNFRYSNATARAFASAAAMVEDGASPERVSKRLFESQPEAALRLLGETLGSLELHHDGRVATVWLTREMAERAGAGDGDAEGLIDYPRSIAGVEAVAMFKQLDGDGRFKVSLRSRGAVDVEEIARRFGGGGHHNAAGCTREGERDAIFAETLEALGEAVE